MAYRMDIRRIAFSIVALSLLVASLLWSSSPAATGAPSSVEPVVGGETTLKLTKRMARSLKRVSATVTPSGSATGGPRKLAFPISGGRVAVSDDRPAGKIRHRGSGWIIKRAGEGSTGSVIRFRNPVIDLGRNSLSTRLVGAEKLPRSATVLSLCFVVRGWVRPCPSHVVELTRQGAKAFRTSLGLNVKPGAKFGYVRIPRIGDQTITD